jgi:hypothetical protein
MRMLRLLLSTIEVQILSGSGRPYNWDQLHAGDFRRSVPMFIPIRSAIDLDELREGYAAAKGRFDSRLVRSESVRGDLELAACCVPRAFNKNICGRLIALAHRNV